MRLRTVVCCVGLSLASQSVSAAPVLYRIAGEGSGWLGPVFYSGPFEITATGEDSEEVNPSPDVNAYRVGPVTISAGGNSVQSILPMAFFSTPGTQSVGLVQVTSTAPLIIENSLILLSADFATYNGITALGPIPVEFFVNPPPFSPQRITTALGDVTWVGPFFNVQFEVIPGAAGASGGATVPEPASLALFGAGLAALAGGRRPRRLNGVAEVC